MRQQWLGRRFPLLCLAAVCLPCALAQPSITTLQSSYPAEPSPTHGNAITGGTLNTFAGITLYINGSFVYTEPYQVTWYDTSTSTSTVLSTVYSVQNTQISVLVPHALYDSVPASQVTINVTVKDTITTNSDTANFYINPTVFSFAGILSTGVVGSSSSQTLFGGGTPPYTVSVVSAYPPGLNIPSPSNDGSLTGIPTTQGDYSFNVGFSDSWDNNISGEQFGMQVVTTPTITPPLAPNSVPAGSGDTMVTVNGANFMQPQFVAPFSFGGSTAYFSNPPASDVALATTVSSSGQIIATVPAPLLTTAGPAGIYISQPGAPPTVKSSVAPFTITIAGPSISTLSPPSVSAESGSFLLTVSGTGFVSGSQIYFGATPLTTTTDLSGNLQATVDGSIVVTAGPVNVTVVNPGPLTSPAAVFQVLAPSITYLDPGSIAAGTPSFLLTVHGANFVSSTIIEFAAHPLATTFVDSGTLRATVNGLVDNPGTLFVIAIDPIGGASSGIANFPVYGPEISTLQPSSATAGASPFTLTVTGVDFAPGSQIVFGGAPLTTTFVDSGTLTASVGTALVSSIGPVAVTVTNPGGSSSDPSTFTVMPSAITALVPPSVLAGSSGFLLTVKGPAFAGNAQIAFNGTTLPTTFVDSTTLTAQVSAAQVSTPADVPVTVVTGPLTSSPFTFEVFGPAISTLVPSSVTAGAAGFLLSVTGANFSSGAQIVFGGTTLATTYINSTSLTAPVSASQVSLPGPISVTVLNPGPVASAVSTFTVNPNPNPTPTIAPPLLSSPLAAPGPTIGNAITSGTAIPGFLLYINGNFNAGFNHTVTWRNTATSASTTFTTATGIQSVGPGQIVVAIPAALFSAAVAAAVPVSVTVTEQETIPSPPPPVTSNAATFLINPPLTATGGAYPDGTLGAAYSQNMLYAGGTGPFAASLINGSLPAGINLSPSAGPLAGTPTAAGDFTFTPRITDAWGNTASATNTLQVVALPTIAPPLIPASAAAGSPGLQITINGTNFLAPSGSVAGSVAEWIPPGSSAVMLATTVAGPTQLVATVPSNLLAAPVTVGIAVVQPNGLTSNTVPFPVLPPGILTLTPSSAVAGSAAFTLTVSGANFATGARVIFGATALPTTFVNSGSLTATVSAPLIAVPGLVNVTVANPGPVTSPPATFTILVNPIPTPVIVPPLGASPPTSTSPTTDQGITGGTPLSGFLLYINGNFNAGDNHTVTWQDTSATTTTNTNTTSTNTTTTFTSANGIQSVSPTQIVVLIPQALFNTVVTNPVTVNVSVTEQEPIPNPPPPITSNTAPFLINPPLTPSVFPLLPGPTDGVPYSHHVMFHGGTPPFTVRLLHGTLPPGVTLTPDGELVGTPYGPADYTFEVEITDAWGNVVDVTQSIEVVSVPSLASNLSPNAAPAGTPGVQVTIFGTGFVVPSGVFPGTTAEWVVPGAAPVALATTVSSTNQATATVPANLLAAAQTVQIVMAQPNGVTSNGLPFAVLPPVISSLQPPYATAGTGSFTLSVNGANFIPGSQVVFGGTALATTFVSGTTLTAPVSAAMVAKPAVVGVVVMNPGGATSAVANFPVNSKITILTTALPPAQVGVLYDVVLAATGGAAPYTWTVTGLPITVTLNPTTGEIRGSWNTAGTYPVSASVVDSAGQTASIQYSVAVGTAPVPLQITTVSPLPPATVGALYSQPFAATGGTLPYNFAPVGSLPPGLALAGGVLSGTPTTAGPYSFSVTVTDAAQGTSSAPFQLTVAPSPLTVTGSVANATVGTALNLKFGATGGAPPYTFNSSGTLPTGTAFTSGPVSGTLAGTLTAPGTFAFTITATDSANATAGKTFTLTVTVAPLTITTTSLPNGTVGAVYTGALAASGGLPPYTWTATGLPPGLSLSTAGAITGSPTTAGSYTVAATVSDTSGLKATQNFPVTIAPAGLTITTTGLPSGTVGAVYTAALAASGGTLPYTWTATGMPAGLSLSSTTGAITGSPTTAGSYTVAATVSDATGLRANQNFPVTISPAALNITTTQLPNGTVGTAYTCTVAASGGTPPYTWTATGLPAGLSISSTTGAITGTPTTAGPYRITVTATDSATGSFAAKASQTFSVTIAAAPLTITTSSLPNGAVGVAYTATLAATGGVSPYTWTATGLPAGLSISSTTGAISGTPTTAGPYTVAVTVTDSTKETTSSASLPLTIAQPPAITSLSPAYAIAGGPGFTLTVAGSNFVSGAQIVFGGTPLSTTFANSGSLSAPVNAAQVSKAGTINVTVVNPGGISSAAAVFNAVGKLTILTASLPAGPAGSSYSILLQASGGLPPYNWSATGLPPSLALNSKTGVISGTWASAGTYSITITVTDQSQQSAVAQYSTTVTSPATALQIVTTTLSPATVGLAYGATFYASGGTSPYSFTAGSTPPGLAFSTNDTNGTLSGTPTTAGQFGFTVSVTDTGGNAASKTFSLVVSPAPLTVTGSVADSTVGASFSAAFGASGGVPPYTFSSTGTLPTGAVFSGSGATATLSGTLTAAGAFSFTVTATDSAGTKAGKTFSMTVAVAPLTINAALGNGQVGVPYSGQVSASGGAPPYTFAISGLPPGVTAAGTAIGGTPTTAGPYTVAVAVTDSAGSKANQSVAVTIAAAALTVTASLPGGTVGVAYSAGLSATGGAQPYSWVVSGLPAGLSASPAGAISGTPTTPGNSTVMATVTDANGATASASLGLTIATAPLSITTASLPGGTAGTAVQASLSATGGVPPYTWAVSGLPAGVSASTAGAISGTPTAAGSFTVTVTVTDNAGSTASITVSWTIGLPAVPPLMFMGLPSTGTSGSQPSFQVGLGNPYPVDVSVTLTLAFAPSTGPDDPSVQFATGGRTATITVPAGQTAGATSVGIQTGTVAGSITITARLTAAGQDVTPSPAPSRTIPIAPAAPVITKVTAAATSSGFTVTIVGYSNTRDMTQGVFAFGAASGVSLQTTTVTLPLSTIFSAWYSSAAAGTFGGQFTLTQPFTVTGNQQAVTSVTVTLTNTVGNSTAVTANVP